MEEIYDKRGMMITHDWIARARRAGACAEAIDWLSSRPRTLEELAAYAPVRVLWAAGKLDGVAEAIGAEIIDRCAAQEPWAALRHAAHLLTPERLDWCAERDPWAALAFAAHLLTPERRRWCEEGPPECED